MFTAKDYDKALLNPAAIFKQPKDILDTDSMTAPQKLEVLKRWETDALLLSGGDRGEHGRRRTVADRGGAACHRHADPGSKT